MGNEIDNINGIYAADANLRSGINTLRSGVLNRTIQPLTVTENNTYTADPSSGVYGYSPVIVDVAEPSRPQLPSEYDELDYVICPSTSSVAGFTINYAMPRFSIIDMKSALLTNTYTECAFLGTRSGSACEFYYENMILYSNYGSLSDLNGASGKSITLDTPYRTVSMVTSDTVGNDLNIGFYRTEKYFFNGKIYYFKLFKYTETDMPTIIWLIPAKRKSDDKVGMYDVINDVFYYSTSGTDFVAPSA